MTAYLSDWLALLIRWIHFIVGVAWIGASFYFNWLENRLERQALQEEGIEGNLWAIHGGGFYHLKKYKLAPPQLPQTLHWFKWEAYTTWMSGVALLCIVYYLNAGTYLIDPSVADIGIAVAIGVSLASMLVSWFFYDLICRSTLREKPVVLSLIVFVYLVTLAWMLSNLLSGRAAYIHVGAAVGTMMVGNVFRVIIPSQKALVEAVQKGRQPDPALGTHALLRSRHNNYLTLPVLFIMISNHYPMTYGSAWNWLVLAVISIAGVAVRHYFNIRHLPGIKVWLLPVAFGVLLFLALVTAPATRDNAATQQIAFTEVQQIINSRCVSCHAQVPSQAGFSSAPAGIELDSEEKIRTLSQQIYAVSVASKTMPIGNLTGMTDDERMRLGDWILQEK